MGAVCSCCRNSTDEQPRGRRNQRSNADVQAEMQEACQEEPAVVAPTPANNNTASSNGFMRSMGDVSMATSDISGKGKPLQKTRVEWEASTPMTRTDLEKQRREFWETVAEFGGKSEAWAALKGALEAWERDLELARTILDCAGLILPKGELSEIYDEFGYRYTLPDYCISEPKNLQHDNPSDLSRKLSRKSFRSSPNLRSTSFSDEATMLGLRKLTIRLSSGEDLSIELRPTIKTIDDLSKATILAGNIKLDSKQKMVFLFKGKVLAKGTKLDDIEKLDKLPIQAWIS